VPWIAAAVVLALLALGGLAYLSRQVRRMRRRIRHVKKRRGQPGQDGARGCTGNTGPQGIRGPAGSSLLAQNYSQWYLSVNQIYTGTSTYETVAYDTVVAAVGANGWLNTAGVFTVPATGIYMVNYTVRFFPTNDTTNAFIDASVLVNGATRVLASGDTLFFLNVTGDEYLMLTKTFLCSLTALDTLEIQFADLFNVGVAYEIVGDSPDYSPTPGDTSVAFVRLV
jgi:hypothetical protein